MVVVPEDDQSNISPASLAAKIFNDLEARTMLCKAISSDNFGEAPKAHHTRAENARALKAQETATTLEGPATKRSRRANSHSIVETDEIIELDNIAPGDHDEAFINEEDEHAQSASRWQTSEDLASFWDTI